MKLDNKSVLIDQASQTDRDIDDDKLDNYFIKNPYKNFPLSGIN